MGKRFISKKSKGDQAPDPAEAPITREEALARKNRKPLRRISRAGVFLLKLGLLVGVVGLIVTTVIGVLPTSGGGEGEGEPVTLFVNRGDTATDIGIELREQGIIRSVTVFKIAAEYYDVSESFQSGEFTLYKGMALDDIMAILSDGPDVPAVRVTFPEGLTLVNMADRIDELALEGPGLMMSGDDFLEAAASTAPWVDQFTYLPVGVSLEGYLFPDTYEVLSDISAQDLVGVMLSRFDEIRSNFDLTITPTNLSDTEIIVLASLIEREAKIEEERPIVAAVIYNRLAIDMRLQIDATVQYALNQRKERLLFSDLEVDSPYNTYKVKGLPPGPIAAPGAASIAAALAPADVDYLYYVLKDSEGHHAFTRTYDEFLAEKRKARQ